MRTTLAISLICFCILFDSKAQNEFLQLKTKGGIVDLIKMGTDPQGNLLLYYHSGEKAYYHVFDSLGMQKFEKEHDAFTTPLIHAILDRGDKFRVLFDRDYRLSPNKMSSIDINKETGEDHVEFKWKVMPESKETIVGTYVDDLSFFMVGMMKDRKGISLIKVNGPGDFERKEFAFDQTELMDYLYEYDYCIPDRVLWGSAEVGVCPGKLYKKGNLFYFQFDRVDNPFNYIENEQTTKFLICNWATGETSRQIAHHVGERDLKGASASAIIIDDYIFRVVISPKLMWFSAYDLKTGNYLRDYMFGAKDPISIMVENSFYTRGEEIVSDTKTILKKLSTGTASLQAFDHGDYYEFMIGRHGAKGATMSSGVMAAAVVGGGLIGAAMVAAMEDGMSSKNSGYILGSNKEPSIHFRAVLNKKDLKPAVGKFDRYPVANFQERLDRTLDLDLGAQEVIRTKDGWLYAYQDNATNILHIEKINR